jgi:hypothetical protein
MNELPIVSRHARDLVEDQFAAAPGRSGRAARRARRRPATSRAPVRTASAALLRALADRLEPRRETSPRSA